MCAMCHQAKFELAAFVLATWDLAEIYPVRAPIDVLFFTPPLGQR